MFAILFADRNGQELSPLDATYAPALLPVAGKPVIEHSLEILRQQKVTKVFMIVNHHHEKIRRYFVDGHRWSLDIEYVMSRPNEKPDEIVRRLGHTLTLPFLALRGDVWNGSINNHEDLKAYQVFDRSQSLDYLTWAQFKTSSDKQCTKLMNSLSEYHALSLDAAIDNTPDSSTASACSPLKLGIQSQCNLTNIGSGTLNIGNFSRLASSARTNGIVVLGNHCIIDEGAQVLNSIVLDDTYIGPGMEVRNAIVMGNTLIRVDLGIVCPIEESFMLGHSSVSHRNSLKLMDRFLACFFLIVLLPAWCILIIQALFSGKAVLHPIQLAGSHKRLSLADFSSSSRMHKALPSLLAIILGELSLFGRQQDAPLQTEDIAEPWQQQYYSIPLAWLSPASMMLGKNANTTLRELTEIELHQQRHYILRSLLLLSQYLFKKGIALLSKKHPVCKTVDLKNKY